MNRLRDTVRHSQKEEPVPNEPVHELLHELPPIECQPSTLRAPMMVLGAAAMAQVQEL